jgi:hypothetical protein
MKTMRRWQCLCLAGLGLACVSLSGCQTNVAGMTLPSGYYLDHPPQYFPPSPSFPLTRELANMESQGGPSLTPAVGTVPPPSPAPIAPVMPVQPELLRPNS